MEQDLQTQLNRLESKLDGLVYKLTGTDNPWVGHVDPGQPAPIAPPPPPDKLPVTFEQGLYRVEIGTGQRISIDGGAELFYATQGTADLMAAMFGAAQVASRQESPTWPPRRTLVFGDGKEINAGYVAAYFLRNDKATAVKLVKAIL
jgi:hypothetical protein